MTSSPPTRRTVVIKANRDTLVLLACTVTVTLALSYGVHQRAASPLPQPAQQEWAGRLADVLPDFAVTSEPMTSDSLVVPKAALALPAPPAAPQRAGIKPQACDTPPCLAKAAVPLPPTRQKLATAGAEIVKSGSEAGSASGAIPKPDAPEPSAPKRKSQSFALGDLNPLHHLPDTVRRPFSYAGTKITGWIDRL